MELDEANPDGQEPIRVLIVIPNPALCQALKALLLTFHDLQVVGATFNGQEALRLCNELVPDVVLMDTIMPEIYGTTLARLIKDIRPQVEIILLFDTDRNRDPQQTSEIGIRCYLPRCASVDEIVASVRAVKSPPNPTFVYELRG